MQLVAIAFAVQVFRGFEFQFSFSMQYPSVSSLHVYVYSNIFFSYQLILVDASLFWMTQNTVIYPLSQRHEQATK